MAAEGSSETGHNLDTSLSNLVLNAATMTRDDHGSYQRLLDTPLHFSDDECRPLLGTYIFKVHWRYPIDNDNDLRQSYEHTLQQHDENGLLCQDITKPQRIISVYLAIACAGFSSSDISSRVLAGQLHKSATRLLSRYSAQIGPLSTIRSILYMTICSLYSSDAGLTWHLIGIAMSKAISLGLHEAPTSENSPRSDRDKESKRLFQVLCLVDR